MIFHDLFSDGQTNPGAPIIAPAKPLKQPGNPVAVLLLDADNVLIGKKGNLDRALKNVRFQYICIIPDTFVGLKTIMDPLHILLVEDDPDDIDLLQAALKNSHIAYRMDTVMQGDNVLRHLTNLTKLPDVIVLDLNLPRMHGREVLLQLKSSAPYQGIPVAILTTSSSSADRDFCQEAGAAVFLTKPTSIAGFQAITQAILLAATAV